MNRIRRIDNQRYVKIKRPRYVDDTPKEFRSLPLEKEVEANLVEALKDYGFTEIRVQEKCSGGKIDIIAGLLCIEVKRELTNSTIKSALGQVLLYAGQTNKQPALAGYPGNCDDYLIMQIREQGCHLMIRFEGYWIWYPPTNTEHNLEITK